MVSENRPENSLWTAEIQERSKTHCKMAMVGGSFTIFYPSRKGLYGLANISTILPQHIDKPMNKLTTAWLDDIIIVSCCRKIADTETIEQLLDRLQNERYETVLRLQDKLNEPTYRALRRPRFETSDSQS